MKHIKLILLILVLIFSCKENSTKSNKNQILLPVSEKLVEDLVSHEIEQISNPALTDAFAKAIRFFPNDSASLYNFYFKWNLTNDPDKLKNQVKRLEKLTLTESVKTYKSIENRLKPLLTKIVNSNTISNTQSDSLVNLYSAYDYFLGESLFSQLLTEDENYNLVWESFRIMVTESSEDTCFISGLINLMKTLEQM